MSRVDLPPDAQARQEMLAELARKSGESKTGEANSEKEGQ